ncbi:S24 family peptidase [Pseudodesulfovibrio sp. JC047]|uniref:S24/S26 family peptidase n=1 Tax=Pseudodesulfovibrio sp. JC047 TaxID=2683199 RepID=UPI0013D20AA8|nr:S24/S26 family peptidase [Pseudodesulfovibrio sp. JC047]NDV18156.1 S24 family peptidase [Pseudodesulfovibrio sp. JC047]
MGFTDDVRQALIDRIGPGKRFHNNKRMADELGVDPSQLNRFLKKERGLNSESLGHILDEMGISVIFGDEPADASKEVRFSLPDTDTSDTTPPEPQPDDYMAVPLTSPAIAMSPGLIPEEDVEGWILVWRHQESLRFRSNLVAIEMRTTEQDMKPTLHAGDIIIVDRSDTTPTPAGKIMLVKAPGETAVPHIKRVSTKPVDEDVELIFFSENNRINPPSTYRLKRDFHGDITRAIGGSVVWAWNDMSKK